MSNYTKNTFTKDQNNSWSIVLDMIKEKRKVLDIGCSSGNFGAELMRQKKCIVDGIDIDEKDVKLAVKKLRSAHVVDIENDEPIFTTEKYDAILMMDVIEHLRDPTHALKKISKLLKPGGRLFFSVPNMAHTSVRLDLLLGKFDYRNVGLLDDTHLHFYTEKYLTKVLHDAGYKIVVKKNTTISYPQSLLEMRLADLGLKSTDAFVKKLSQTKGNIYQFVGVAEFTKTKPEPKAFPAKNPHEYHFMQLDEAMNSQHKQLQKLEKELRLKDQHTADLEATLNRIVSSRTYKAARLLTKPYRKNSHISKINNKETIDL